MVIPPAAPLTALGLLIKVALPAVGAILEYHETAQRSGEGATRGQDNFAARCSPSPSSYV